MTPAARDGIRLAALCDRSAARRQRLFGAAGIPDAPPQSRRGTLLAPGKET